MDFGFVVHLSIQMLVIYIIDAEDIENIGPIGIVRL
jgi:hypothetical protein